MNKKIEIIGPGIAIPCFCCSGDKLTRQMIINSVGNCSKSFFICEDCMEEIAFELKEFLFKESHNK